MEHEKLSLLRRSVWATKFLKLVFREKFIFLYFDFQKRTKLVIKNYTVYI